MFQVKTNGLFSHVWHFYEQTNVKHMDFHFFGLYACETNARRVLQHQTPNPLLEPLPGCQGLLVFVKPDIFEFVFGLYVCETSAFSTSSVARSIQPLFF